MATGQAPAGSVVLVGAGNVARCDKTFDEQTATLLDGIEGTVFTTGDNVYNAGTTDFESCYGPSWGRHKARTRPTPGEIDYLVSGAAGYFGYFGAAAAGAQGEPYYSYDTGTWHVVVLNSSVPMGTGSTQQQWLATDLATTTKPCVVAYWHFPRFSSFGTAIRSEVKPLWESLYAAQADIVLNGHYRLYERFGPQTPLGAADAELGIRQFTVGTGGQGLDAVAGIAPRANSEAIRTNVYGALRLILNAQTYNWEFVSAAGQVLDSGEGACHGRPGSPLPNNPPTARPGGPYQAERTVTFDGSASTDVDNDVPLTYSWNFGDGTTGSGVSPTKTYRRNGTYTVTLVAKDALGLASAPATTTVTIANLAPEVSAGPDVTVQIGTAYTMKGTFFDEGGSSDQPWSWTITWGDGTSSNGSTFTNGAPITTNHTYAVYGEYTARITVADRTGASRADEALVSVRDPNSTAVLVGAGDIAECGSNGAQRTAALLDGIAGTVITLGDNAYQSGTLTEYNNCYHPYWGRHKARTKPAPGNHEYDGVPGAGGYYAYFGAAAGDPSKGYYSYYAGEWLVVVLNSASGGANRSATSPQVQWLRNLLSTTTRECVVAYMHHAQFTSADGRTNGQWNVIDLWNALYDGGVELMIAAHDHLYDRFARMRPDGTLDPQFGIRQITVGTGGGEGLYQWGTIHPNSERRINTTYGVIKLTLRGGSYSWQFVPVANAPPGSTDSGTETCHGRPGGGPPPNQAPTAHAGGPYQAERTVDFDGAGSSDPDGNLPLSYYWTFGDGTVGSGVSPTKIYSTNGTYSVSLVVTDALGRSSAPATAAVTIGNMPPVVDAGPDADGFKDTPLEVNVTFDDPGGSADGPWTWTIAWGDGTSSSGSTSIVGGPITRSHTYTADRQYTVRATVTDKDGRMGSDDKLVTIRLSNYPPIAVPGGPYNADQTVTFNGSASSDPDNNLPLTYSWNFGDGTTGSGVSPTKTYAASRSYTATLVVTDAKNLSSTPVSTAVTIANVAPGANAGPDGTVEIGSAFTLNGTFTDPGGATDGPWGWTIAWGDGASTTGSEATLGASITRSHTYGQPGQYTVRLTVTDKDGGAGVDEAVVTTAGLTLVGAGNIARCDKQFDEQTAALLDGIPGAVFTTGDNAYGADFANCYSGSWGRHQARTRPSAGDTDYPAGDATNYYTYFGAAAGEAAQGYYSYDLGGWHIVVLNSSTSMVVGSAQEQWLKTDLAATSKPCILAYFHFPRFSSSGTSLRSEVKPLWDALYAAGADVVLNGHARVYERFAPQTPAGIADPALGIRQFTIGTGGQGVDAIGTVRPNSEARSSGVYGVLKLTLDATSYRWEFVPVAGQTFTDSGTAACH
jgi:PKD repeat protein